VVLLRLPTERALVPHTLARWIEVQLLLFFLLISAAELQPMPTVTHLHMRELIARDVNHSEKLRMYALMYSAHAAYVL